MEIILGSHRYPGLIGLSPGSTGLQGSWVCRGGAEWQGALGSPLPSVSRHGRVPEVVVQSRRPADFSY